MKLQKKQLEPLLTVLNYPIKKFAEARKRDRFLLEVNKEFNLVKKEERAIYEKFALKDKKGEFISVNDRLQFQSKDVDKINKEREILLNEEIDIVSNLSIGEVRVLIENSTVEFGSGVTLNLDSFFEIKKDKKDKK